MAKQGELFDRKGVPVYPGDLIRSDHFIGARRKRYYLYHTAVDVEGVMWMVPTSHLDPCCVSQGGNCVASQEYLSQADVIDGHGPEPYMSHDDRPKRKAVS